MYAFKRLISVGIGYFNISFFFLNPPVCTKITTALPYYPNLLARGFILVQCAVPEKITEQSESAKGS